MIKTPKFKLSYGAKILQKSFQKYMESNQSGVCCSFQKNIKKNIGLLMKKELYWQKQLKKREITYFLHVLTTLKYQEY